MSLHVHPASANYGTDLYKFIKRDLVTALTVGSTIFSAIGSIQQGNAQAKSDAYNASVARQNAKIAEDQGKADLARQQTDAYRKLGAIKAGYGASGITQAGSPMDVLADSFTESQLDANTIIYNSKIKAAGYTNTANLDDASAKNARAAGRTNAASSLLLGGTKAYGAADKAGYFD